MRKPLFSPSFLFFPVKIAAILALGLTGCGKSDSDFDGNGDKDDASKSSVFYFSAASAKFEDGTGALYAWDLSSGKINEVLTGQSGDPWLLNTSERVLFLNRKATSLNYRTLSYNKATQKTTLGTQIATPSGVEGDAHGALETPDSTDTAVLLSEQAAGKLVLFEPATGVLEQDISTTLDGVALFDADNPFRPSSLWSSAIDTVWVLHSGFAKNYALNDSQAIFKVTNTNLTWNISKKVALSMSNPAGFFHADETSLITAGLCFKDQSTCKPGIGKVDLSAGTFSELWDMNEFEYYNNGSIEAGPTATTLLASVVHKGTEAKAVVLIDFEQKTTTVVRELAGSSASINLDPSSKRLYVGEKTSKGDGQFTTYDFNGSTFRMVDEVAIGLIPYGGAFAK